MDLLASCIRCKVSKLQITDLDSFQSSSTLTSKEEKFQPRLAFGKRWLLSKDGRLTLLQSTWSSNHTHFLSAFVILRKM